jgi:hypothetical protein
LTFYELDLGLNHVVRKWSEPTDRRANLLVQVPGGQNAQSEHFDGPSGVLVCTEDHIIWKHMDVDAHRIPIPRRRNPLARPGEISRGNIIVAAVMHKIRVSFIPPAVVRGKALKLINREHSSSCSKMKMETCSNAGSSTRERRSRLSRSSISTLCPLPPVFVS